MRKIKILVERILGILLFVLLIQSRVIGQNEAKKDGQGVVLKGYVYDEKKQPLPGVTVMIVGSTFGVATDMNGWFQLLFPAEKGQLKFSFIGFKDYTLDVSKQMGKDTLCVILREDLMVLEEAVITGYSTIRKESFTGTSTKVNKTDLLKISPQNVLKALSVFDPSMKLIANNAMGSDPNTMPEYYIRGRSGVSEVKELDKLTSEDVSEFALKNNPSAPTFILDGFEVDMEKVYDMDINRIESITILKDAAATAVYGSRAANGVIVIETVAPIAGEIRINYSGTASLTIPDLSSYNLLNAQEALEAEWYAGLFESETGNDKNAGGLVNYAHLYNNVLRGVNTDWISKPLQNEFNHKHYLYLDGGTESLRWGVDLNYQRKGGVMKQSKRNNYGAGLTVDYRYKRLQIKNKTTVNIMESQNSPYGEFSDYVRMKPYLTPIDPTTGNYYKIFSIYRAIRSSISSPTYVSNPLYEATLNSFDQTKYREFADNLGITWYINNYLLLKGTLSASFKIQNEEVFIDPTSGVYTTSDVTEKGSFKDGEIKTSKWNLNALLSYNRTMGKNNFNFSLGVEASESESESQYATYKGFVEGTIASPNNALDIINKPSFSESHTRRFGSYFQLNYTYGDIYLFDVSGRYDGSSAFGANKKMGIFWSFGIGLNLHKYAFMQNIAFVDQFKLKATYGQTGKANFSPYQAQTMYETLYNDGPYNDLWGMTLKALGNEELKWEKVNKLNVGTEITLLKNTLSLNIDYYHEKTIDQVEDISIPASSGFKTYKGNVGEVLNQGIDIKMNVRLYTNQNWDVFFFANANHNRNEITKIGDALKNYNEQIDEFFSNYDSEDSNYSTPFTKYEVGNSLSAIYGMKSYGIDPATGNELYIKRDGTTTYIWSSTEQQCLGDYDPDISGTCGLNLRWKNLTLYTTFSYQWGGQAYNNTLVAIENVDLEKYSGDRRILTDRWQQAGDYTTLKNIKDRTLVTRPTSRFVQDNNSLTFSSLSLGYDFDRQLVKKWGLNAIRMQFNMEDICTFSSIKQERGTSYPFARTFNFSLNITL